MTQLRGQGKLWAARRTARESIGGRLSKSGYKKARSNDKTKARKALERRRYTNTDAPSVQLTIARFLSCDITWLLTSGKRSYDVQLRGAVERTRLRDLEAVKYILFTVGRLRLTPCDCVSALHVYYGCTGTILFIGPELALSTRVPAIVAEL
jgi:hypothetical protein